MPLRILFAAVAIALAGLIVWAFGAAPFWENSVKVVAEPWGRVMLGDLSAGFFATTALFFALERRTTAIGLFVALMVLGNVVTLLWLAVRGWQRLRAVAAQG